MPYRLRSAVAVAALLAGAPAWADATTLQAADGTSLHALAKGDACKKGVVLVHMLGREAADWEFFADRLAKSKVRSVAVDLRGA